MRQLLFCPARQAERRDVGQGDAIIEPSDESEEVQTEGSGDSVSRVKCKKKR